MRPAEAAALLDTLHAAGLVVPARSLFPPAMPERLTAEAAALAFSGPEAAPARTLRRRAAAKVVVTGASRLAPGVAVALAEAGAGHVHPDLTGAVTRHEPPGGPLTEADIGEPRAGAVAEAIRRSAPGTRTHPVRHGAAFLVIQLGHGDPATSAPTAGALRHRPRLTATVREGSVSIGPLFLPGSGPCPECIARHRADRGAQWPQPRFAETGAVVEPCSVATLLSAVARITHEALTFLDGGTPETLGAEVVITTPARTRRRTWAPHPACRCTRRAGGLRPEGPVQ
jgi:bacteriocin biosynthesis cyclodehydratase domain-containing protein